MKLKLSLMYFLRNEISHKKIVNNKSIYIYIIVTIYLRLFNDVSSSDYIVSNVRVINV
jgi:hypothetical protein